MSSKASEYMKNNYKKWLIVDKMKQLVVYQRGLQGFMYTDEYMVLSAETQEEINKELNRINNWIELNKELKTK